LVVLAVKLRDEGEEGRNSDGKRGDVAKDKAGGGGCLERGGSWKVVLSQFNPETYLQVRSAPRSAVKNNHNKLICIRRTRYQQKILLDKVNNGTG
jgi:hypothetical protein